LFPCWNKSILLLRILQITQQDWLKRAFNSRKSNFNFTVLLNNLLLYHKNFKQTVNGIFFTTSFYISNTCVLFINRLADYYSIKFVYICTFMLCNTFKKVNAIPPTMIISLTFSMRFSISLILSATFALCKMVTNLTLQLNISYTDFKFHHTKHTCSNLSYKCSLL